MSNHEFKNIPSFAAFIAQPSVNESEQGMHVPEDHNPADFFSQVASKIPGLSLDDDTTGWYASIDTDLDADGDDHFMDVLAVHAFAPDNDPLDDLAMEYSFLYGVDLHSRRTYKGAGFSHEYGPDDDQFDHDFTLTLLGLTDSTGEIMMQAADVVAQFPEIKSVEAMVHRHLEELYEDELGESEGNYEGNYDSRDRYDED